MAIEAATEQEHAASESSIVVLPPGDEVSVALADTTSKYSQVLSLIGVGRELAARYQGVVADVHTAKGYEQIAAMRTELREKCRYPLQKLGKEISKTLGTLQRNTNRHIETLVEEAAGFERPFQEQLDAADARKEAERREREEAEQRRKDGHMEAIAAINRIAMEAVGLSIAELEARIASTTEIIVDESYEEFQGQAMQARDEALRQLQGLLVAARADEEDRREAEEARARQAAFAQAQAEAARAAEAKAAEERAAREKAEAEAQALRDKVAAMERAEQERLQREAAAREEQERAARERAEGIQQRIDAMNRMGAAYSHMAASANIEEALNVARGMPITADLFGDRTEEAQKAKDVAIGNLREVLAGARTREAEEAAAAQRAHRAEEVERRIADIHAMGPRVDDSAAELRQRVARAEQLRMEPADYDDRFEEAGRVWNEVLVDLMQALVEATQREERAVEEAERQRQQAEADRAMRELHMRMQANCAALYAAVRALLIETVVSGDEETNAYRAGRELLLRINPTETFED